MEKEKQKVPDEIRLLTMKVIDNSINTKLKSKGIIYGCWKEQEDFYFDTEEELDNFRLKNKLVVFPTFKVEFFGSVVDFKDVIKITTLTDSKDGEKNTSLTAFKGTTIYTPTFEDYEGNIVEEIVKTKKVKFLYGDIHPHKIYKKLQEVGFELETINNDWILEEQVAILEDKLGIEVNNEKCCYTEGKTKIKPKTTIWGYLDDTYPEEQQWFLSREELDAYIPESQKDSKYYLKVDFFGHIGDCSDVMKITKHGVMWSDVCVYTPTFDGKNVFANRSEYVKNASKYLYFYGDINLTSIYELLSENGIVVETDYKNCGKQEGVALVKKPNEAATPANQ